MCNEIPFFPAPSNFPRKNIDIQSINETVSIPPRKRKERIAIYLKLLILEKYKTTTRKESQGRITLDIQR